MLNRVGNNFLKHIIMYIRKNDDELLKIITSTMPVMQDVDDENWEVIGFYHYDTYCGVHYDDPEEWTIEEQFESRFPLSKKAAQTMFMLYLYKAIELAKEYKTYDRWFTNEERDRMRMVHLDNKITIKLRKGEEVRYLHYHDGSICFSKTISEYENPERKYIKLELKH